MRVSCDLMNADAESAASKLVIGLFDRASGNIGLIIFSLLGERGFEPAQFAL